MISNESMVFLFVVVPIFGIAWLYLKTKEIECLEKIVKVLER